MGSEADFDEEELIQLPTNFREKLDNCLQLKNEEISALKSQLGITVEENEKVTADLRSQVAKLSDENGITKKQLDLSQRNLTDAENRIRELQNEVKKLNENLIVFEGQATNFRKQRDVAVDEKDSLLSSFERTKTDNLQLREDLKKASDDLQKAITEKFEALAKLDEVKALEKDVVSREKSMESEFKRLTDKIKSLEEECRRYSDEVLNARRKCLQKEMSVETKYSHMKAELERSEDMVQTLTEKLKEANTKLEKNAETINSMRNVESEVRKNYEDELSEQKKLVELYKNLNDTSQEKIDELIKATKELQTHLTEAANKYAELENESSRKEELLTEMINDRADTIKLLKEELERANELLKARHDEDFSALEEISPTAAVASRMLKAGLTMTEVYSEYVKINEESMVVKEENRKLKETLDNIMEEMNKKTPQILKLREDYRLAVKHIASQALRLDAASQEVNEARLRVAKAEKLTTHLQRENDRLKSERKDLIKQVAYLVKQSERLRAGISTPERPSSSLSNSVTTAEEVVDQKLLKFGSIDELVENNQKLLRVVKELGKKLEEAQKSSVDSVEIEEKLKLYERQIEEYKNEQASMQSLKAGLQSDRDMYKELYEKVLSTKSSPEESPSKTSVKKQRTDEEWEMLTKQLEEKKQEIREMKENHDAYRKDRKEHDHATTEEMHELRKEITRVKDAHFKLLAKHEYSEECAKVQANNLTVLKKNLEALEARNKQYMEVNLKYEESEKIIRERAYELEKKVAELEVKLENSRYECKILQDSKQRLQHEKQTQDKMLNTQTMLMSNIEAMKCALEQTQTQDRFRLQNMLEECNRECAALRRRLQEEQDHCKEEIKRYERQAELARQRLDEEKELAAQTKATLNTLRNELEEKSAEVERLNNRLKEANSTNPESQSAQIDELEKQVTNLKAQIKSRADELTFVNNQLTIARNSAEDYKKMSQQNSESYKKLVEEYEKYRLDNDKLLKESKEAEEALKTQIEELTSKIGTINTSSENSSAQVNEELESLKEQLCQKTKEAEEFEKERAQLKERIKELESALEVSQEKYSNEVQHHSADLEALGKVKEKLIATAKIMNDLEVERSKAESSAEDTKALMERMDAEFKCQLEEMKSQIKELEDQNSRLHDQIQLLGSRISLDSSTVSSANTSLNISNISNLSQLEEEEDKYNPQQLLEIIKYLRRQKEIALTRYNATQTENNRLHLQLEALEKQLQDTKGELDALQKEGQAASLSTQRHDDLIRKVETVNALNDSNRLLREERDALHLKVTELSKKCEELEAKLGPLTEINANISKKLAMAEAANQSYKENEERLRQRISALVERSVKAPPEEWRRLQTERDTLAKNFCAERDAHQKLQDETANLKKDKENLDKECHTLRTQIEQVEVVIQSLLTACGSTEKKPNLKEKLDDVRVIVMKKIQDFNKFNKVMKEKEITLEKVTQKEFSIRKIAKKYKEQYEELQKSSEAEKKAVEERIKKAVEQALATAKSEIPLHKQEQLKQEGRQEMEQRLKDAEEVNSNKIKELVEQVSSSQAANDGLSKEIDTLKKQIAEKEDHSKKLLKNARQKITLLTDENTSVNRRLEEALESLQTLQQSKGKTQAGEGRSDSDTQISRLEKENIELKSDKERLAKDIESLHQRMNIIQRQLEKQQGQGAGEKLVIDPPTANIKPMAGAASSTGKSSQGQQSATVTARPGRGDTPFASIRPMSLPARTAAVYPTSQIPSTNQTQSSAQVLVAPQQQVAHTTVTQEVMSTSPTSSHTEYVSASSSAGPTVRQAAVQPTPMSSTQDTEAECSDDSTAAPQQVVAMVLPRMEQQSSHSDTQVMEPASSQTASSSSVTTTQAGIKRQRDSDGDGMTSSLESDKLLQQTKRVRSARGIFPTVTSQGNLEVEYQVPTSSQRDQDDDVIVLGSDEGEEELDEDEEDGEELDEEEEEEEEEDDGMVDDSEMPEYELEGPDIDEDSTREQDNEAEVTEDSSEVMSKSSTDSTRDSGASTSCADSEQQSEATSTGNVQTSAATVMQNVAVPIRRSVPPLSRQQQQQQLVLPQGYEDAGDDCIVPSTPTLFVPRRTDSFGETVGSPQVPQGRFTFSETSAQPTRAGLAQVASEGMDDTRMDLTQLEESGTGRSVPTTPLQVSPQEVPGEVGQSIEESLESGPSGVSIPTITVTEVDTLGQTESTEGVSEIDICEADLGRGDQGGVEGGDSDEILELGDDGSEVSSGDKQQTGDEPEEGREAESTEAVAPVSIAAPRISRGTAVRSVRPGISRARPGGRVVSRVPIVWTGAESSSLPAWNSRHIGGQQQQQQQQHLQQPRILQRSTPTERGFVRGSPQMARRTRIKTKRGFSPYHSRMF